MLLNKNYLVVCMGQRGRMNLSGCLLWRWPLLLKLTAPLGDCKKKEVEFFSYGLVFLKRYV